MLEFIRSLFRSSWPDRRPSSLIAKNRLTVVLVQDRAGLTSKELDQFKKELLSVLEKYFVIDVGGFDIEYKRQGEYTVLTINSPVIVKRSLQEDYSQQGSTSEIQLEIESAVTKEKVVDEQVTKDI